MFAARLLEWAAGSDAGSRQWRAIDHHRDSEPWEAEALWRKWRVARWRGCEVSLTGDRSHSFFYFIFCRTTFHARIVIYCYLLCAKDVTGTNTIKRACWGHWNLPYAELWAFSTVSHTGTLMGFWCTVIAQRHRCKMRFRAREVSLQNQLLKKNQFLLLICDGQYLRLNVLLVIVACFVLLQTIRHFHYLSFFLHKPTSPWHIQRLTSHQDERRVWLTVSKKWKYLRLPGPHMFAKLWLWPIKAQFCQQVQLCSFWSNSSGEWRGWNWAVPGAWTASSRQDQSAVDREQHSRMLVGWEHASDSLVLVMWIQCRRAKLWSAGYGRGSHWGAILGFHAEIWSLSTVCTAEDSEEGAWRL